MHCPPPLLPGTNCPTDHCLSTAPKALISPFLAINQSAVKTKPVVEYLMFEDAVGSEQKVLHQVRGVTPECVKGSLHAAAQKEQLCRHGDQAAA